MSHSVCHCIHTGHVIRYDATSRKPTIKGMGPRGVVSSVGEFNVNEAGRDCVMQTRTLYVMTEEPALRNKDIIC